MDLDWTSGLDSVVLIMTPLSQSDDSSHSHLGIMSIREENIHCGKNLFIQFIQVVN